MPKPRRKAVACLAVLTAASLAVLNPAAHADNVVGPSNPAVTMDSSGWIHYNQPAAANLSLQGEQTVTIAGAVDSTGTCTFTEEGTSAPGSAATYTEEVAVNPGTCQQQLVQGGLTTGDEASLNAQSDSEASQDNPGAPASTLTQTPYSDPLPLLKRNSVLSATTSSSQAYEKTSYIDPVWLTITSLSANLTWTHNGSTVPSASYRIVPYEFRYDGWSNTGTPHPPFSFASNSVSVQANETFRNNDFEQMMIAVSAGFPGGPAYVYAACGFSVSTAVFNLRNGIRGNANGTYTWSYNDSTSGGCSDLVRHRHWSGYGSSN